MPKSEIDTAWTMSIIEAGRRYYGTGKNQSYELVRRGIMPVIKLGDRKKRALPRVIEKQLRKEA
jgi:hypothetical protein